MAISNARVGIANGKLLLQLSLEYQLVLVVESPCIERRICVYEFAYQMRLTLIQYNVVSV